MIVVGPECGEFWSSLLGSQGPCEFICFFSLVNQHQGKVTTFYRRSLAMPQGHAEWVFLLLVGHDQALSFICSGKI